ncbi:MAG: sulfurtransferase [Bacteroidales bacterium]|nr:sulfurtransferase [Bacteroidales bacterium]
MKTIFSLIFSLLIISQLSAQKISANDLAPLIGKPNVVVVDARTSADYLKTHVNGAINLDVETLCDKTPYEGKLKDKASLASILGKHGITADKTIVVYCKTGVNAGRLYWILKYMGCKDVKMLDGQMDGWFSARKPITKVAKTPTAATFTPAVKSSILVDKAYVQSKLSASGTIIVDTRKKADYDAGHIGNAINVCYEGFLTGTKIKANAALTTLFETAGVTKDKEVILYCKTSTSAGLAYFILTSLLNYTNVKVYDGAYSEWSK